MTIRTLVIDDEAAARRGLLRLIAGEPDLEVIGECGDGDSAVRAIHEQQPDLVFLVIQMPGANGLEVVRSLGVERMPAVVFVTAFDEFAVAAFEVHAVDYLVKPVDPERFRDSVQRVRERRLRNHPRLEQEGLRAVLAALGVVSPAQAWASRLPIRGAGRITLVEVDQITSIQAAGNAVTVRTGREAKSHTFRESLTALEARLDPAKFARVSRSAIVNLQRITELQPLFDGDFVVLLDDGSHVTGSRRYRDKLGTYFG
jgi:two-component system LytT family response regulator